MKPEEANDLAKWMHGLFPSLTPEQVIEWAAEFERHHPDDVRTAVSRHHKDTTDGFVRPAGLAEGIRVEAVKRLGVPWEDKAKEAEKVELHWKNIHDAIDAAGDDYLAEKKAAVLPRLAPAIRRIVEKKSVRESKLLMCIIYAEMTGTSVA